MKTTTTLAAILATIFASVGAAEAQDWGGVAGIAAARGYSASSGFGMMAQPHQDLPIVATDDAHPVAAPPPRARPVRSQRTEVAAATSRKRLAYRARFAGPRAPLLAKAKRLGVRHRARVA